VQVVLVDEEIEDAQGMGCCLRQTSFSIGDDFW